LTWENPINSMMNTKDFKIDLMDKSNFKYNIFERKMTDTDFDIISKIVTNELGIKMPPQKKTLLEARLFKRLKELNLDSYEKYIKHLTKNNNDNEEITTLIDLITTNKTDFFREPKHFDILVNESLNYFYNEIKKNSINIWSAGCSSGEEVYTIAMVIEDKIKIYPSMDYKILGTDISQRMINSAVSAVYNESKIADIPFSYKKKFLMKHKNNEIKNYRIVPELRAKTSFLKHNLMNENYNELGVFDIIFCRNVLIYFESDVQLEILEKLSYNLKSGGYLFLGHSETITKMNNIYKHVHPAVYRKI